MCLDLGSGLLTLHREQRAARLQQRKAPSHQSVKWRYRACGSPLRSSHHITHHGILSPTMDDPDLSIQPQVGHHIVEKRNPAGQRLDQIESEVGAPAGQREPGQAGPRPDIDDPRVRRHQFPDNGAVQQVALPQARHLAWADQPTEHTLAGQPRRKSGG